jgi:uncharacterized protein
MEQVGNTGTLAQLIRLQELHSQISTLQARVDAAPGELDRLDEQMESDSQEVRSAEESIEDSGRDRRRLEGEVDSLRAKLAHYKDRLMEVKTNTEYQAMLHEIAYVEEQIVAKEDLILEQMMAAEELERKLADARRRLEERGREILARKAELESFLDSSRDRLSGLSVEMAALEGELPRDLVERYHRIAAARSGVALAAVVDQCCEACHVRQRPQLLAELRGNRDIILCENCSRILYYAPSA